MRWQVILPKAFTIAGLLGMATFEWGAPETLRITAGAVVLWGPFALLMSLWLRPGVPDAGERLALSVVGSYAMTALVFFGLAVCELESLFPWVQVAAVSTAVACKIGRAHV